jgi:hypothetical protein
VYIQRATLADMKSKCTYHAGGKKRLWMLSSSQLRHDLYAEAAQALASVEQSLLPSFGGRSWEVTCGMSEENGNTLFRAWKGKMELAVLPHLFEKIPDPPTWPGRKSRQLDDFFENEDEEDTTNLQSREVSTLSSVAWDLKHQYPEPNVTIKWQSPDHKIFNSRKAALEHAHEIAKKEVFIDKHILGIGASGKLLQPTIPSGPMALKVGKLRFERDGLWVVNQELGWQEDRPQILLEVEEEKRREEEMDEEEEDEEEEQGDQEGNGDNDDNNNENENCQEQEEDSNSKEPQENEVARERNPTPLIFFIQSQRHEYRTHKQQSMNGEKLTLRQAETELRQMWKALSDEEQNEWKAKLAAHLVENAGREESKGQKQQRTSEQEKDTKERKATPLTFFIQARRHGYRKEKQDSLTGASFTLREAESELREVWKTLSKEERNEWKEKSAASFAASSVVENVEGVQKTKGPNGEQVSSNATDSAQKTCEKLTSALPLKSHKESPTNDIPSQPADSVKESPTVLPMETKEEKTTNAVTLNERVPSQPVDPAKRSVEEPSTNAPMQTEQNKPSDGLKPNGDAPLDAVSSSTHAIEGPSTVVPMQIEEEKKEEESSMANESNQCKVDGKRSEIQDEGEVAATVSSFPQETKSISVPEVSPSAPIVKKKVRRKSSSRRKKPTEKACQRWCLTDDQIDLCYSACMSHYEDVMRTVTARNLVRELADGFDVLRERGRGRFDMVLPSFDTDEFSFLTDMKKAPWMPIVKTILGDDIVLIHKGCFLSLPDAETQVYHQDGVHLTTQTQKPCHAINVFVPLVDLTTRNGPTEFCLGSHILGNDGFDKDFEETPKPKAGTPVIFDYRLGHRGLGNSSTKCRPIVYCTYARGAAGGKEFRDSANFSRKRYHKIGELTKKPLSREERRLHRKRSIENRQIEAEAKKVAKIEEQQNPTVQKENESETKADEIAAEKCPLEKKSETEPMKVAKPSTTSNGGTVVEAAAAQLLADRTKLHQEAIALTLAQRVQEASVHPC